MTPNGMTLILSITERGYGKALRELLERRHIRMHLQTVGHGTAPTEMMDILGLGSTDKDVIASFALKDDADALIRELGNNLNAFYRGRGILMTLPLASMSNLVAAVLQKQREAEATNEEREIEPMKESEYTNTLILITVNQGYSDVVMQTAKSAGATGGTVIRGRFVDPASDNEYYGIQLQPEREILAILSAGGVARNIMEKVNRAHGVRTDAQGVICSLPVDRAFKI